MEKIFNIFLFENRIISNCEPNEWEKIDLEMWSDAKVYEKLMNVTDFVTNSRYVF